MSGLREAFDQIVADVPRYGDLDRAIEQAAREQRRRHGTIAGLAAAAAVVAIVVSTLVLTRDGDTPPRPIGPGPTPSETTSRTTSVGPGWDGAVRADQASLPLIPWREGRLDGADAAVGAVDIRRLLASDRPEWRLTLASRPPLAETLDPRRRVMEHGVVVDTDGDLDADCRIAISTDAPTPGDLRVWVTDLRTGSTREQVGPPYGVPIDFAHPAEGEDPGTLNRTIVMFFLGNTAGACSASGNFYSYGVLLERGRPTASDFAPDDGWLAMP